MNLKKYLKEKGLQLEANSLNTWNAVNVCFLNPKGFEDEVQFDVEHVGTKAGNEELINLFEDFCKENNFPTNTVYNVVVVASARTYEELEEIC